MENVKDKNGCYNVAIQGIHKAKTSTYQELCSYPERYFILYDWYWSMAYTYDINPSDDKFIFPEFAKTFFQEWGVQNWFKVVPYVSKSLWTFLWEFSAMQKKWLKYVFKNNNIMWIWCVYMFWGLCYASNMLLYASVTLLGITVLVYIFMLISFLCLCFCYSDLDYSSGLYYYVLFYYDSCRHNYYASTMNNFDSEYPFGDFLGYYKFDELSEFLLSHFQKK